MNGNVPAYFTCCNFLPWFIIVAAYWIFLRRLLHPTSVRSGCACNNCSVFFFSCSILSLKMTRDPVSTETPLNKASVLTVRYFYFACLLFSFFLQWIHGVCSFFSNSFEAISACRMTLFYPDGSAFLTCTIPRNFVAIICNTYVDKFHHSHNPSSNETKN